MYKKFVVFVDEDSKNPVISLDCVEWHKNIKFPEGTVRRKGGGWWYIEGDTLFLYDLSGDFGKYNVELARQAFENKNVLIYEEPLSESSFKNINKLDTK